MQRLSFTLLLLWVLTPAQTVYGESGPWQATGFKTGEVTDTTAIVWTRLTLREKRNPADAPMVMIVQGDNGPEAKYPEGVTVKDIRDAVPGANGEVRVIYKPKGVDVWKETEWKAVDPNADFTRQFALSGLKPNTQYVVHVEARPDAKGKVSSRSSGGFKTAPSKDMSAKVVFTVSTGQMYRDKDLEEGYKIYPAMLKRELSFFVHTGDIVYYDRLAKTKPLADYHWQRTYSLPTNVKFHNNVTSYFIKDDHDTWQNDCWPTMKNKKMGKFTFEEGLKIFPQQVPMGKKTYRTFRWGKDLQVWMVEGRDFRSSNRAPDGPNKTIWGKEQKEWLMKTMKESDATFRILISPTPIVGPDRTNKKDNHSNSNFSHEGNEVRKFLASLKNVYVVCGDRHWQYVSVDPKTKVREYSCGPASNQHAGGWKQSDYRKEFHKYLKVTGGYLAVTVDRENGKPTIAFRHHSVNGKVLNEEKHTPE